MAAVNERKETITNKIEDAREFAELLEQLSETDKEKIKYIMIGLKMNEAVRATLPA